MKIIILSVFCFITAGALSQTNFQGKVVYTLSVKSVEQNSSDTLEIYFGRNKIKGVQRGSSKKKEDLLIDFEEGLSYTIKHDSKTYQVDKIEEGKTGDLVADKSANKILLNQPATAYSVLPKDSSAGFGAKATYWYADSIFYIVPQQYVSSQDVTMFTNGKNLGLGMYMGLKFGEVTMIVEGKPMSIEPMSLPDSLFIMPADYVLDIPEPDSTVKAEPDSIVKADLDEIEKKPARKAPVKKAPAKKAPVKKAPVKNSAVKKQ